MSDYLPFHAQKNEIDYKKSPHRITTMGAKLPKKL